MPKSRGMELAVLMGLEVVVEGVAFDTHNLRKLPFSQALVTKVLKSLRQAGIFEQVNTRKYLFTDKFVSKIKEEVLRKTPRSGLMQFPTMTIFDMCGIGSWSEHDLEHFERRLRDHWDRASGRR